MPYAPRRPEMFALARTRLQACLPRDLVGRIEHFGSTAVPGPAAKPIVHILVEVAGPGETRRRILIIFLNKKADLINLTGSRI